MVTGMVAVLLLFPPELEDPPEPEDPLEPEPPDEELLLCATGLTPLIFPSTTVPFGICTVTGPPSTASDCLEASRLTVTTIWVDEVCRIGWALAVPPDVLAPEPEEPAVPEGLIDAVLAVDRVDPPLPELRVDPPGDEEALAER